MDMQNRKDLTLWSNLSIFYIYKNRRTDVCLYIFMSVGLWRANGNPIPCTDFDKIHVPTCPSMVLEQFWSRPPHPLGPAGLKLQKLKDTFLKTVYKTEDVYQVGTSARMVIKIYTFLICVQFSFKVINIVQKFEIIFYLSFSIEIFILFLSKLWLYTFRPTEVIFLYLQFFTEM